MNLIQLTDLHLRPAGKLAYGRVDSNAAAVQACRSVAKLGDGIDAVICTGDLADNGLPEEYETLRSVLAPLGAKPVFLLAGNHDRREAMLAQFPGLRQENGFIQYTVEDFPVRLVMLDSVVPGATHGTLCPARLDWLEQTLATQPERETMLALHHPPMLSGIAQYDETVLDNRAAFEAIVAAHPNVRRIICGHNHRLSFGNVAQAVCVIGPGVAYQFMLTLDATLEEGFTLEPSGFLLHRWTKQGGFTTHGLYSEPYPGPFKVQMEPEYPGKTPGLNN